jgi:hypothetical protein
MIIQMRVNGHTIYEAQINPITTMVSAQLLATRLLYHLQQTKGVKMEPAYALFVDHVLIEKNTMLWLCQPEVVDTLRAAN